MHLKDLIADRPKRSIAFELAAVGVLAAIAFAHLGHAAVRAKKQVSPLGARISARVADLYDPPLSAWVAGLLIGDDSAFSPKWKEIFLRTGTTHLTAVSGANVASVVAALGFFVKRLFYDRRVRLAVSLAGVTGFALLTGAPMSVLRAALMYSADEIARHVFGRPIGRMRALLIAALILSCFSPAILTDDRGFQLSALATFGLAAFSEPLAATVFKRLPGSLREWAGQTAAATLMTAPFIAWMNGRYSLVSLFANMAVAAVVPLVMGVGAVALASSVISVPLARFFADLTRPLAAAPLLILKLCASVPGAALSGTPATVTLVATTAAAVIVLARWWKRVGETNLLYAEDDLAP